MNKTDLEKLKNEIEKNHEANITAINKLISLFCENERQAKTTHTPLAEAFRPKERLSQIVERIIRSCDGEFDIPELSRRYGA